MNYLVVVFMFISSLGYGQNSISSLLEKYNSGRMTYINVEMASEYKSAVFLDAREIEEFNTSHINGAIYVGYNKFNSKSVLEKIKDKNTTLIVYCSIGIRSEIIAEKLAKLGYTRVFNLYGGIFEWKNNDKFVVDNTGKKTEKVHTFNKRWSKYLKKGTKIY